MEIKIKKSFSDLVSLAEEIFEPLPIKDWKTNAEYNHWINDYNKFKKNFPKIPAISSF